MQEGPGGGASTCFALKVAQSAFFEELFVGLLSGFDVGLAELEHAEEQTGEFVGPALCRRSAKTRLNALDEGCR